MSRARVIEEQGADVLIRVKAVPGAKRDEMAGLLGDRLKVRVSAPPEGGKANRAICAVVAGALNVKPGAVSVERGTSSAEKLLRVRGADVQSAMSALGLGE